MVVETHKFNLNEREKSDMLPESVYGVGYGLVIKMLSSGGKVEVTLHVPNIDVSLKVAPTRWR